MVNIERILDIMITDTKTRKKNWGEAIVKIYRNPRQCHENLSPGLCSSVMVEHQSHALLHTYGFTTISGEFWIMLTLGSKGNFQSEKNKFSYTVFIFRWRVYPRHCLFATFVYVSMVIYLLLRFFRSAFKELFTATAVLVSITGMTQSISSHDCACSVTDTPFWNKLTYWLWASCMFQVQLLLLRREASVDL